MTSMRQVSSSTTTGPETSLLSMRDKLDVQVCGPDQVDDVALALADAEVTLAEVFAALGVSLDTTIDGQSVAAPDSVRAVDALARGSRLASASLTTAPKSLLPMADSVVDVSLVAGVDAGRMTQLAAGSYRIEGDWVVQVDPHRQLGAGLGAMPWHQHGSTFESLQLGDNVLAIGRPVVDEVGYGTVVHRPPRSLAADDVAPIDRPDLPVPVHEPSPLSWSTLLAPIPIAIMMAVFFRPIFAVFAAMGPVMAIGRWYESRRRYRRQLAQRNRVVAEFITAIEAAALDQAEAIAQLRWQAQPHVGELWKRARTRSVRLWERRPTQPGFLQVAVAIGPDETAAVSGGAKPDPRIHRAVIEPLRLRAVPHLVDLSAQTGFGIHGDRASALAMARSVILQLATLHGPADLQIGVVSALSSASEWEWIKWLPHIDPNLTATSCAPIATHLHSLPGDHQGDLVRVIVVDHVTADVAAVQRAADDLGIEIRFIAIAPRATALPAVCTSLVAVSAAEPAVTAPAAVAPMVAHIGLSAETAVSWARSLAPLVDPEAPSAAGHVGRDVSLLQLSGVRCPEDLSRRWCHRPAGAPPVAVVGLTTDAHFAIDLDSDGPHALVAGTTGSGKSELLRTLVVALAVDSPPDLLNFVLIDFKGGGAFDAVDRLPHVAGLITDLDESLVARAIASLRSELQRREVVFRELGVSSFEEAVMQSEEPPARLVVVIDEFATLATEYSELMASIIDLAARGRSLGIHLVLATQRPSGVVDQKIRANTNLRVALRVQDPFDSQDVVGTGAAAAIDRRSPGTAVVSVGGDSPVMVQMAYSGAPDRTNHRCLVRPLSLFGDESAGNPGNRGPGLVADNGAKTELSVLVDTIAAACESRGHVARSLWPEPLPPRLDWIDLEASGLADPQPVAGVSLGLEDVPDLQTQRPWRWHPRSGPLALYGASAECAAKALVALGATLASGIGVNSHHLYVIDGDAGGVSPLGSIPATGAYVTLAESDRIERTIRFFESELTARRSAERSTGAPALVLMIDNIAAVLSSFEDNQAAQLVDRLSALARDGAPQKVHLVIAARTVRDIGHRLSQQFPNRLVLALADLSGYLTLGLKARDVPVLPKMRAIDLSTHRLVQLVEPPDLTTWVHGGSQQEIEEPHQIGSFPEQFSATELPPATFVDGVLRIPVGIEAANLGPAVLELRRAGHALIVAASGMGRSSTIDMIAHQLATLPELDVVRLHASDTCASDTDAKFDDERVRSGDRLVVVIIDDGDQLSAATARKIDALIDDGPEHVRIVAGTTPMHARSVRSWAAKLRAGGTGMLIGVSPVDADLFGARVGRLAGCGRLPGRGHLVVRGRALSTQFAKLGS